VRFSDGHKDSSFEDEFVLYVFEGCFFSFFTDASAYPCEFTVFFITSSVFRRRDSSDAFPFPMLLRPQSISPKGRSKILSETAAKLNTAFISLKS